MRIVLKSAEAERKYCLSLDDRDRARGARWLYREHEMNLVKLAEKTARVVATMCCLNPFEVMPARPAGRIVVSLCLVVLQAISAPARMASCKDGQLLSAT